MADAFIDKIALIYIKNRQILMALSKGKDAYYIPGGKREVTKPMNRHWFAKSERNECQNIAANNGVQWRFHAQAHGKPRA